MKKQLTKILALSSICLLMLSACKKNDVKVTSTGGTPGILSTPSTTVTLSKANLNDVTTQVVTFNFTPPKYGFSAAVTNTLQIDSVGDNWAHPMSVTLAPNALTTSFNTADFNSLLLKLHLKGGVATTVNARIAQSISSTITPVYSNVLTLSATPFNLISWIYLVGQFNGYSTSAPDSLISATSNGIYNGIINVTTGNTRFLVLPAKNFNTKYATTTNPPGGSSTTLTYSTEFVSSGGNDLYTPSTPGFYFISLNTNTNSITVAPANTYSAIGNTAGEAPGASFNIDVPLTKFINDGATGWQGVIAFTPGSFKIRQNDDWSYSWGLLPTPDGVTLTDSNGGNIPITAARNYTVSFNIAPSAMGASASASKPPSDIATYKLQ